MARLRNIRGVLNNFLSTFTSRYSDFNGYWLFGFLMQDVERLTISLLNPETTAADATPRSMTMQLASEKFADQMSKAGLTISSLQQASLDITTRDGLVMGVVNGRTAEGRNVNFRVRVLSKAGKEYESSKLIFVAPHNPNIEQCSARAR